MEDKTIHIKFSAHGAFFG